MYAYVRPPVFYLVLALLPLHLRAGQPLPGDTVQSPVAFFPSSRIFPRLFADGMVHQFGVSKDFSAAMIHGSIGNELPVLEIRACGINLQCGAGATVLGSFVKRPRLLDVVTVDFLVEFPVDLRLTEQLAFRTGYGHFSAHLADDGIEILGGSSINYAKDYVIAVCIWHPMEYPLDLYAGGHWDFHSLPEEQKHWMVQAGAQGGDIRLLPDCYLYGALDVKLKSEVAWGATQSYQCGVKVTPRGNHALRIAYTFRTGIDIRGQFFWQRSTLHLLGVYLDF
jgi:hypothetical protein